MLALLSLTEEHQLISQLLGALQTYATRLRGGVTVDPADIGRFSEVFRELVDYRHHEKEEGILMPLLARNGFEWSTGLLAELRHEHGHLRHLIDVLCQAAATDSLGSREQRRQVAETALAFVHDKRRHIQKETEVLLPAIAERLGARAIERLGAELAQFDEATGRTLSGRMFQQAAELVQRHRVDSGTVDVTELRWAEAGKAAGVGMRGRRELADIALTSFGRSR